MSDFVLGIQTFEEKQILTGTHPAIIRRLPVAPDQGELEPGLIVSEDAEGRIVPYEHLSKVIGTGDGVTTSFSGSFDKYPLEPGSVKVTDGTQVLKDDGHGNLYGDGSGEVNYQTGEVSATFENAPNANITASAARKIAGVLLARVDTSKEFQARVIKHGTVAKDSLKTGDGTLTEEDLKALEAKGIWAE